MPLSISRFYMFIFFTENGSEILDKAAEKLTGFLGNETSFLHSMAQLKSFHTLETTRRVNWRNTPFEGKMTGLNMIDKEIIYKFYNNLNICVYISFLGWSDKCQADSQLLTIQCYCEKMLGSLNRDGQGRDNQKGKYLTKI